MTAILGISAYYHDAAAALIVDGEIVACAQEERFSRIKHDPGFPTRAVESCLERAGLTAADLDYVGYYDKPYLTFDRLLETYLAYAPRGFASFTEAMPVWLKRKLYLPREMRRQLGGAYRKGFVFTEHHESHAAGAFFPSPFEEAAILTMDGVGEWATASFGVGRGNRVELSHELRFPHSLGLLYGAFTTYCGFQINSEEYKLMGLAPFGEPRFVDLILEKLVDLRPDGSFRIDMSYFDYAVGQRMTSERFHALFCAPPRAANEPIAESHMDLAASIQKVAEEIVLRMGRHVHARTGMRNLCLSGGVALNCVANGRLLRDGPFEKLWIQPAAGDAGSALGAALFIWHQLLENPRTPAPLDSERGAFLGTKTPDDDIETFLRTTNARWTRIDDDEELAARVAELLDEGKVVGWFQGAMEFGPRALGARSILADPRRADMQSILNRKVKFREGFRPFAPAVLAERAGEWFEGAGVDAPYMLIVFPVSESKRLPLGEGEAALTGLDKLKPKRSLIPAVTHVDYSARVQTVDAERHGLYRKLIAAFERRTGCPVVVNTSFNLSWEPIVRTPAEAYETFMSSGIDALCAGHFLLTKQAQPAWVEVAADRRVDEILGEVLESPCCHDDLARSEQGFSCAACGHVYPVEDGIPLLYSPHERAGRDGDVTDDVRRFYEKTPFPNYQDEESLRSLIDKSRRGAYAHALHRSIGMNTRVLEVGCGTGQLTNFLGVGCRRVIGTDLCLNSLRLGETFRREQGLDRVAFMQMNLFQPAFREGSFDVVLCNGVLHHTSDPKGGFQGLTKLVRPGGAIVIGLYHRYGRIWTDLRRTVFRLTGGRGRWLDPHLRGGRLSEDKAQAWFADQYRHPHESKHTLEEVLDWFAETDVEFLRAIPSAVLDGQPLPADELFTPTPAGSAVDRLISQLGQMATGSLEGGLFLMIGRRRGDVTSAVGDRRPASDEDEAPNSAWRGSRRVG